MENRSQIVQEFFELIVYLNRGNTKSNAKTELIFDIRINPYNPKFLEFGCYLKGVENPQFLVLCRKFSSRRWSISNYTRFTDIEDYCCDQLNLDRNETNKTVLIKKIITNLRSFGILQK